MTLVWDRVIRVETVGLVIEEPRITLELDRDADDVAGRVIIYNLAPDTEAAVNNEGERIRISAGHRDSVGVVLDGSIRRVTKSRRNLARLLELEVGSRTQGSGMLGGVTNRAYSGSQTVRQLVLDFAADLGLRPGLLAAVPSDARVEGFVWSGSTTAGLKSLLEPRGLYWWEDDGVLRVGAPGVAQVDLSRVHISQETGMIGSPAPTDEGAEVRTWLQPQAVQGATVVVDSEVVKGEYKAVSVSHRGDNWQGPWETGWTLRAVGERPS